MSTIAELRTKRERLLTDANAMLRTKFTPEQRLRAEQMISESEDVRRELETLALAETCSL